MRLHTKLNRLKEDKTIKIIKQISCWILHDQDSNIRNYARLQSKDYDNVSDFTVKAWKYI